MCLTVEALRDWKAGSFVVRACSNSESSGWPPWFPIVTHFRVRVAHTHTIVAPVPAALCYGSRGEEEPDQASQVHYDLRAAQLGVPVQTVHKDDGHLCALRKLQRSK